MDLHQCTAIALGAYTTHKCNGNAVGWLSTEDIHSAKYLPRECYNDDSFDRMVHMVEVIISPPRVHLNVSKDSFEHGTNRYLSEIVHDDVSPCGALWSWSAVAYTKNRT
jgi:hypothetical protein